MIGTGNTSNPKPLPAEDAVYQALDIVGDGSGSTAQNVNGSGTPVKFFIQPPVTEKYTLKRLNLHAIDSNWNNALNYGAINTLPNGIRVYTENDSGIIKEYTSNFKIQRTHDWALLAGSDTTTIGNAGEDPLVVRWTFANGYSDIVLDGSKNERFCMEIPDDLSGLDYQVATVQGGRTIIT